MEGIDKVLLKVTKHLDIHSLNWYKKNNWKDEEIVKALKTVCEPEIKNLDLFSISNRRKLLIKFLDWQYSDDTLSEGDKAMVDQFIEELNL